MSSDESVRRAKIDLSLQEYERSVELSPNNAQLWDEWASVYMAVGDQAQALAKLEHSLELDSQFTQTYLLLGDLHLTNQEWDQANAAYQLALAKAPEQDKAGLSQYIEEQQALAAGAKP